MTLESIKNQKEQIISRIYHDFENTKETDRFFTIKNIEDCSSNLDKYISLLAKSHESKNQQKGIAKNIKWIFKQLSSFKSEYEEPEFLWGFIYNGYTNELTDFILNAAFAYGFEKSKPKNIKSNIIYLAHNPHYGDIFRIYVGSTDNSGVILLYNRKTAHFEYNENPYGDSYGLPIFNLKNNDDFSEVSFDVLTQGSYKTMVLKAQKSIDKVFLKAIYMLHKNNAFKNQTEPDYCQIELETKKGMLFNLSTTNYDSTNHIISMYKEGTGADIFVKELDSTGAFQNSDNLTPHPEIIAEKFVIIDAVPKWKYYEVDSLNLKDDTITVTTKNKKYEYKEGTYDVISSEVDSRTLTYQLKTYDFMIDLLNTAIPLREPFKSRFD